MALLRRTFIALTLAASLGAHAQGLQGPWKIVAPFPPGGPAHQLVNDGAEPLVYLGLAVAALALVTLLSWWLSGRLDGLGGDAYGAAIEASEAVMLVLATL